MVEVARHAGPVGRPAATALRLPRRHGRRVEPTGWIAVGRRGGPTARACLALALVPVVFWPVGKRYNETLAVGYVVFRGALESVLYIVTVLCWLLLIALSEEPDAAPLAGFVRTTVP